MSQYVFGTGQLFAMPVGGGAPLRLGALQDVSVDFQGDTKMLYGQYQFALDTARGKTKIEWKASSGNIDVEAFNQVFFGEDAGVTTGDELVQVFNEAANVPSVIASSTTTALAQTAGVATATFAAPHGFEVGQQITVSGATAAGYNVTTKVLSVPSSTTLTYAVASGTTSPATVQGNVVGAYKHYVDHASDFYLDLGVYYASSGAPLKQVASGPAAGEYSVSDTGIYTFAAADLGLGMLFNYMYESASTGGSLEISNQLMGNTPRFQLVLSQTYEDKVFTLILYSNVADKLSLPLKQDDYLIAEISGSAHADDANRVGRITTTSITGGGA